MSQQSSRVRRAEAQRRNPWRDLFLGLGALALFVILSLTLLIALGSPDRGVGTFRKAMASIRGGTLDLTLMHTNDTWGYLAACGG